LARQDLLAKTFVELADNLVADFDTLDLMSLLAQRTVDLLDVDASGLMLSDARGGLQVMASSTETAHLLELSQLQNQEGPCLDAFRTARPVMTDDLRTEDRWPHFGAECVAAGFASVSAFPMRLRDTVIGGLNLFREQPGGLDDGDTLLAQALADVATITILQERMVRDAHLLSEQLQRALNSRVVVEQAKGVVAERVGTGVDEALAWLRGHARHHNRRLTDVAEDVIAGRVSVDSPTKRSDW